MDIEKSLKTIGDWISKETELRKYPKSELLELSESLQALKAVSNQYLHDVILTALRQYQQPTDAETQEAICNLEIMATNLMGHVQDGNKLAVAQVKALDAGIAALRQMRMPTVNVPSVWTDEMNPPTETVTTVSGDDNLTIAFTDGKIKAGDTIDELQRAIKWLEEMKKASIIQEGVFYITKPPTSYFAVTAANCRALLDALRWIPVSERLPESGELCLCAKQRGRYGQSAVVIAQHQGDGRWSSMGLGGVSVTHWKPLPKPPESDAKQVTNVIQDSLQDESEG